MKNLTKILVSTTALALAISSHAAYAQTVQDDQNEAAGTQEVLEDAAQDQGTSTIVVTGSRIRRPDLESTVPVTTIAGEAFFQQGQNNIGDTLNDLPQLNSTFSQQNPGLGIGIAGLNLLDLRGLGTQRTLVLVNGRRHVAADILNNAVSPDVNTIPNDLIERVDIVTGGNSAIYGSDAIAGVVNFILKDNYDGLQLRANAGITGEGFGANQYISALAGRNFAGGRGNITLHGEYSRQERVFASDVPYLRTNDGLAVTDLDPAGLTNGSDGIPDRTFIRDIRSTTINRFGLVPIQQPFGAGRCGTSLGTSAASMVAYNCTYVFQPDGTLVPQTGTRFGSGINASFAGGNGQTGREEKLLSVLPFNERYNFNLLGKFEFAEAAELFVEAKWNRVNVLGSNAGPSFIQGVIGQFDFRQRTRIDNPFLNAGARTTITNALLAAGCGSSLQGSCNTTTGAGALSAADRANIANGSYRFTVARNLADSGIRDEKFQRDTYRIVGGLRGNFNDDWNYELSVNYGKFEEDTTTFGYVDRQRFLLAIDAGRNPATGQIQCRSQFDPASAVSFNTDDGAAGRLASDIAACVPYNPFGAPDNSASSNYFSYNARHTASQDQLVVSGFVAGDLSQLFELPGGPVSFAIGGEYRREKAFYQEDPFVQTGATNAVVIPTFSPPAFDVKEAFGELRIPILSNRPFFEELTLSGAGRVAKYQGGTGTVFAYNGGFDYAPIRDIRFRGNYSRAVRAPNVSETAFPLVPNFAPGFQDPCRSSNIGSGSATRAANCAADLGALLNTPAFANLATYSLQVVSGSNPNLEAETSDSYTIGAVIQPSFIPGFSLNIDYYDITVNGVIVSVSAQQIADGCYDAPTLSNPFCGLFTRFQGPGTGSLGEVPGQILGNSLIQAPLNFAKRTRKGIDTTLNYNTELSTDVSFNANLIYTHNFEKSNFSNPTDPDFEDRLLSELGDPKDEFRLDMDLGYKQFTFGYRMRYIGPQFVSNYEDFNALQGRPAQNIDYADTIQYDETFYHDLRAEWNIREDANGKGFRFNFGVDNVLATNPPLGLTGTGAGSAIYRFRGRSFYAGARARF